MSLYTLTYSDQVEGWVSFYSYQPDWMIGMNNYFYTFKGGNLYRHNVNPLRNTFYGQSYDTTLKSVFNDVPLENKLFKTINLEGDDAWQAILYTDIQNSGYIAYDWFEKKEQSYYAFVRNEGTVPAGVSEYALRSLSGIGRSYNISGPINATQIDFSVNPLVAIGSIISIGDLLYYSLPPYNAPLLCGVVTAINQNYPLGINNIIVDATIVGDPPPIVDPYFLFIKNSEAESHGVLGHYCVFELTNSNNNKIELFAVETEVMKSFP
jgi:fumarate reductase subunit C